MYRDQFKRNALQAWLYGWTGDNGDPDNFLCVFFCNTTQNGRWDDANADRKPGNRPDAFLLELR